MAVPLTLYLFDALHLDGDDLIDRAGVERHAVLAAIIPEALRCPGRSPRSAVATGFLADALARGHEGVLVKALAAPYEAGRRGAGWFKVKPVHTLDLVVLAVEWGHGRRRGWLSNLHLGARDPKAGGFVMLGKTFKGLTDKLLAWQTERLLELADGPTDQWVVRVRPELVVEIAFDGVQTSPRYPGGVALRFARVLRYRPDKRADEADTIGTVRAIHGGAPPRTQDAAGGAGRPPDMKRGGTGQGHQPGSRWPAPSKSSSTSARPAGTRSGGGSAPAPAGSRPPAPPATSPSCAAPPRSRCEPEGFGGESGTPRCPSGGLPRGPR